MGSQESIGEFLERCKPTLMRKSQEAEALDGQLNRIRMAAIPKEHLNAVEDVISGDLPDGPTFRAFRRAWNAGERRIWVWGPMGCGKSTAMAWAALKSVQDGGWISWFNADLAEWTCEDKNVAREAWRDAILSPMCCLDDLHKIASLWPNIRTRIGGLVNARNQSGKPYIAASISPPSEVGEAIGQDIVDRFPCVIRGTGESMRKKVDFR